MTPNCSKRIRHLIAALSILLFLAGCVSSTSHRIVNAPLRLVVSRPIGNAATAPFPSYVIRTCLPIPLNANSDLVVPNVTVTRIGLEKPLDLTIAPKLGLMDWFRSFWGSKKPKDIEKKITEFFQERTIGAHFAASGGNADRVAEMRMRIIQETGRPSCIIYCGFGSRTSAFSLKTENGHRIVTVSSLDSARRVIADVVAGLASRDKSPEFILFYESIDDPKETPLTDVPPQIVPLQLTPLSSEDEAYYQYEVWRASLPMSDSLKRVVLRRLKQLEVDFDWDYRFSWARAYESVDGQIEHHEAFELLYRAAEKAIENGDQRELLDSLNRYAGINRSPIWQLSKGHTKLWDPLLVSLHKQDKVLLKAQKLYVIEGH